MANEKEKKVKPFTTVQFKHNGNSKFHNKGHISILHPEAAEKMRAKGFGAIVAGTGKDRKNSSGEEQRVSSPEEKAGDKNPV